VDDAAALDALLRRVPGWETGTLDVEAIETGITNRNFRVSAPDGVFVVCDAATSGTRADATILRYLFHASRKEVLVASSIHARFDHRSGAWRLVAWRETYYDYAP